MMASRSFGYGSPASIAVCIAAMTSPASAPIIVKPRMRSSFAPTRTFMKPCVSSVASRRVHGTHRQFADAHGNALPLCVPFAQPDMRKRRIGEHAGRHQPVVRAARAAGQVVADDAKIIDRDMGELRAASTIANGPDIGRGRLQTVVDAYIAARIQCDARRVEADAGGVRNAPDRDQDVACLDRLRAGGRPRNEADAFAGSALYRNELGRQHEPDAFLTQNAVHRLGDVRVLPADDLRRRLDHRHLAAEAAVGLRQFQSDIAGAEHDQVRGCIVQVQCLDMRERPRFGEAGNARYRRMRTDIDEDLVAGQPPRAAVVETGPRATSAPRRFRCP